MSEEYYGWYSDQQANACGTIIYLRPDGSEVEVSQVNRSPTNHGTGWTDIVCLGPVSKMLYRKRPNPMEFSAQYWSGKP